MDIEPEHTRRPVVGIGCQIDTRPDPLSPEHYAIRPHYIRLLKRYGAAPLLIPPHGGEEELLQVAALCDAILLPGGNDIDPARYGQDRIETTNPPQPVRDDSETLLIDYCLTNNVPLLGVCRGHQMINVALGGTMFQDVVSGERTPAHWQDPPYDALTHQVTPVAPSPIATLMGSRPFMVNSIHHQGVDAVAPRLRVGAVADDGLVESLWCPEVDFCVSVQWHPEFIPEATVTAKLIGAYLNAARARRAGLSR